MDLSALIFVALAVAWAAYLVPKALRHHEEGAATRAVDGSQRMRVLARREPVDSRSARLVVSPGRPTTAAVPVEPAEPAEPVQRPVPVAVRRAAAHRAARRRMRVLLLLLLVGAGIGVAVAVDSLAAGWLAAPAAVLVAWLVACRLMVRRERAAAVPGPARRLPVVTEPPIEEADPETETPEPVAAEPDPEPEPVAVTGPRPGKDGVEGWDPVPVTLPTYVAKEPAARRTVRTIDLDSTGVWTSGRTAADSALAREADAERTRARDEEPDEKTRRASS